MGELVDLKERAMLDRGNRLPVPTEAQRGCEVSGRNKDCAVGACLAYAPRKFAAMPNHVAAARHTERFIRDRKLVEPAAKTIASAHKDDARVDLAPTKSSG
jgi:hypothetical protein